MKTRIIAFLGALMLGGCLSINSDIEVADGKTIDGGLNTINGSVRIGNRSVVEGSVKTVNGSVTAGNASKIAGSIETVNGKIALERDVQAESARTVNGSIAIGEGARLADGAETVNGQIVVAADARVEDTVSSVNGQIRIQGGTVGALKNSEGGIVVEQDSRVLGELRIVRARDSRRDKPLMVEIHAGAEVIGPLIFERDVRLRIHETATVGEIQGAEPEYFDD
ncbi:MAG: hypothetical protein KGY48_07935 [Wenzhouxiangellaceae bacterium]|nr:hypothetical protein [Wenzhouxiangellaceae bacterium]MBS3746262.1 hypothetical protein [Wenzhouxiangellaceae bacterium]MBS3824197.1 hypothetical protein [Wenzhouxiangellaceae bacterium]